MKICPNCGSEVLENAEYCTRCGWHFEKAIRPQSAADPIDKQQDTAEKKPVEQPKTPAEKAHLPIEHADKPRSEADENKHSELASNENKRPDPTSDEQVKVDQYVPTDDLNQDETIIGVSESDSAISSSKAAVAPGEDAVPAEQAVLEQKRLFGDQPQSIKNASAELNQKTAISAASEAKAIEKTAEHEEIKSRMQARKAAASKTKTNDADSLDVTLDLEHAKQGFSRAWNWLIESLRHPGEYRRPSWRWTGLMMLILEALFSVITISWMVDHLSEKIAQLASGSAIVFHIKAMTAGSLCLLWLLIVVAALLMSAVAYVFKRYVDGSEGGDWIDMINHLTWASNFNVVLILLSLLLAVMTSSLGMMTLVGIMLLIALGLFALAIADEMLKAGPQKLDRIYGALIVLVINGLIVFAAISLGGKLIKEIIVALMLQLF